MSEIEQWASIPLTKIKERVYDEYIAVEDIDAFNKMTQHVVKYAGMEGDYIIVESDGHKGRLLPLIYQKRDRKPPAFVNDEVKFYNSKGKLEFGTVKDLFWHDNREGYVFTLEVNGKEKGRMYEEKDLEKI